MKYGLLTYVRDVEPSRFDRHPRPMALYRCDCGKERRMRKNDVVSGKSRSCGCAGRAIMRGLFNAHAKEMTAAKRKRAVAKVGQ
jgi:hypothetical protein